MLKNKRAVIYGAGGAVGSAVAEAFARHGATVVLAGRRRSPLEAVAARIGASEGWAWVLPVDALNPEAVAEHCDEMVAALGGIDISFNVIDLGDAQGGALTAIEAEHFLMPVANAMRTHFLTATAAARHMKRQRSGVILALTAQAGRKPYVDVGGFGVACAAIEALCRQLAVELGPDGIRVACIRSAGSPDTPGVAAALRLHAENAGITPEEQEAKIASASMLKRMPRLAEIADAAVLLASDHARAVTAEVMNLTGGELAD
ncbi:SDR family oxidoreductase [Mesorhizobium sp. BR1-1-16]|uniref:SDR family NAD(P)-dependent oxidoreductase n=1 Tax=Mesorhizobium sp. BR1-1-16 TaxID=2876653 RepID=UPI001CCDB0F7|nr:SDR family oxidoreductase [Mesorhizobium sp. BR1-1-16]MBZ9936509.1 SDR family oxidoreductase [Mesorhizobium sp. BR1-1-16]